MNKYCIVQVYTVETSHLMKISTNSEVSGVLNWNVYLQMNFFALSAFELWFFFRCLSLSINVMSPYSYIKYNWKYSTDNTTISDWLKLYYPARLKYKPFDQQPCNKSITTVLCINTLPAIRPISIQYLPTRNIADWLTTKRTVQRAPYIFNEHKSVWKIIVNFAVLFKLHDASAHTNSSIQNIPSATITFILLHFTLALHFIKLSVI